MNRVLIESKMELSFGPKFYDQSVISYTESL